MNPRKLMAVALCAAACVTTTAFAEDDFGIESATPTTIVDPVNPQQGMVLKAYRLDKAMTAKGMKDSFASLMSMAAIKTLVDKGGEEFSLKSIGQTDAQVGMWTGFLQCKRTGKYTLTLTQGTKAKQVGRYSGGYSLKVNGKYAIQASAGQTSVDVDLKVGWNQIIIVCQFFNRQPALSLAFKPKDSLSEARALTPGMMFHDQKPEEEW